jgi:hypothetical protein
VVVVQKLKFLNNSIGKTRLASAIMPEDWFIGINAPDKKVCTMANIIITMPAVVAF